MFAKEYKSFLFFLLSTIPQQAKLLLKYITRKQYLAIKEVAINLLRGCFDLTPKNIKELRKHRNFYRNLAKNKNKVKLSPKAVILLLEVAKDTLQKL